MNGVATFVHEGAQIPQGVGRIHKHKRHPRSLQRHIVATGAFAGAGSQIQEAILLNQTNDPCVLWMYLLQALNPLLQQFVGHQAV